MPRPLTILSCLLLTWACQPVTAQASDRLGEFLGQSLSVKRNGKLAIEYCPDNTCELIRGGKGTDPTKVADFAFLYFFFVSDYAYLEDLRTLVSRKHAESLVAKYSGTSLGGVEERAVAVLRRLGRDVRVSLFFVRFDEGERHLVPLTLEEELSKLVSPPSKRQ
jgi:hypothetical protein